MSKSLSTLKRIERLKSEYFRLYLEKPSLIKIINQVEVAEQVYNSNAIENCTLSLDETEKVY